VSAAAASAGDPFNALGDPHRRQIVELLGAGGRSVRDIADALPISRPAVSRHLRLLKDAGLVIEEPLGTQRIYRLHDYGVAVVRAYLEQVWGDAAARLRMFAENTGERADDKNTRGAGIRAEGARVDGARVDSARVDGARVDDREETAR
jgi:DNA-binding transcriptional ArsR family regulator